MRKIFITLTFLFFAILTFAQSGWDYIPKLKSEDIKIYNYADLDSGLVINGDTAFIKTIGDTLLTLESAREELDTVLFSYNSDTSKIALKTQTQTNILRVDKDINKGEFTTIQGAIDSANTQTGIWQIQINEGVYNEQITLYDSIQLVGVDDDMVIIQSASPVITFASEKSAIRDVTVISTTQSAALYANNTSSTSEIKIQNCDINTGCCAIDITTDGSVIWQNSFLTSINSSTANLTNSYIKIRGDALVLFEGNFINYIDNRASGDLILFDDNTTNRSVYANKISDLQMINSSYTDNITCYSLLGSGSIDIQNTIQNYDVSNGYLEFINTSGGGDVHLDLSSSDLNFDKFGSILGFNHSTGDTINVNLCSINEEIGQQGDGNINILTNVDGTLITNENVIDRQMAIDSQTSTNKSLRDFFNITASAGWVSGGEITVLTDSTVTISSGSGLIRTSNNDQADLKMFDFPDTIGLYFPNQADYYIYVDYNAGNPIVKSTTNGTLVTDNENDKFELYEIVRNSDTIHITEHFHKAANAISLIQKWIYSLNRIERSGIKGGLIISEIGTRNIFVSTGQLLLKLNFFNIDEINTSVADDFDRYYRDGSGGWIKQTKQTQWDNVNYDDGTGTLATVASNRYSFQEFYIETDGDLVSLYGQDLYISQALAETAPRISSVPTRVEKHSKYLGRVVFQGSGVSALSVLSAFVDEIGGASSISSHNDLAGLNVAPYLHLTSDEKQYISDFQDSVNANESDPLFDTKFATKTTDNLVEGTTNLYDKTVSFSGGSNITIGGTYPNFTVTDNSGSSDLELGETSTTAYRGDRGKIAYDHSQLTTGNPHNVLATQITDFQSQVNLNDSVIANSLHRRTDFDKDSTNEIQNLSFNSTNGIVTISKGTGVDLDGRWALIDSVNADFQGTENYIPKYNLNGLTESNIYDNGNIGIGTTTPDYKLDVNGTFRAQINSNIGLDYDNLGQLNLYSNQTYSPQVKVTSSSDDVFPSYINFQKNRNGGALLNGDALGAFVGQGFNGSAYENLSLFSFYLDGTSPNNGGKTVFFNRKTDNTYYTAAFTSNGLRINGASKANYDLDVGGDINFTGDLYKNGVLFNPGVTGTENYISKFGASGVIESVIYENASNNIGIGTTTPTQKLDINGSLKVDNDLYFYGDSVILGSDLYTRFYSNYGTRFLQLTELINGDMNIAFSSSNFEIECDNGLYLDYKTPNYGTNGQVLTSDGAGGLTFATVSGSGTITGVTAGSLLDGGGTSGTVSLDVDLSEASSDNTYSSTDELIYLTGTTQKRGTVLGLQTYMQNSLDFTGNGYWEDNTTYYRTVNIDRDIRLLGQDLEIYESTGTYLGLELTSTQSHELIFKDASFQPLRLYGDLVYLKNGGGVSEFSTDGTLAGNSDTAIPTEKAVKTYVDNNSTALKSTVPQSITTTADCTNYLNFYTTASSDKTITFTNVDDGDTGNIEVIYSGSSEITIAESITEVTIIKIAPNIEGTASNKIITKSSGEATYSYWRRGSRLYIVGTQF